MSLVVIVTLFVVLYPLITRMFLSDDIEVQYQAAQDFLVITKWLIPPLIIIVIIALAYHLLISHRICGPLVNFIHTFKRLSEGDLTRKVFLRHGDLLRCECEKINDMIDAFAENLSAVQADSKKLLTALEDNLANVEDLDTRNKVEDALKIVKERAQSVTDDLAFFKLDNNDQ